MIAAAVYFAGSASAASWMSAWSGTQPPLLHPYQALVKFGDDGSLYLGDADGAVVRVSRVDANGTLGFSRAVSYAPALPSALWPGAAGDAVFMNAEGQVGRIDAAGTVSWMHPALSIASSASPLGADRVLVISCTPENLAVFVAFDRASGVALWHHAEAGGGGCLPGSAMGDGAGNAYAVWGSGSGFDGSYVDRLVKFDAQGQHVWTQTGDIGAADVLIGANTTRLFVRRSNAVAAVNAADGELAWSASGNGSSARTVRVDNDIVVNDDTHVARLDGETGAVRWTTTGAVFLATQDVDGVLIGLFNDVGGLSARRFSSASGAVLGNTPLAADLANAIEAGRLSDGSVGIVGQAKPALVNSPVRLYRFDAATGTVLPTLDLPTLPVAIDGLHQLDASGNALGLGVATHDPATVRVRKVDATGGAELWQAERGVASAPFLVSQFGGVAGVGSAVIASVAESDFGLPSTDVAEVMAFDGASGGLRWAKTLRAAMGQGETHVSRALDDGQGNPVVALTADVLCGGNRCPTRSILKLDKTDGHVLWRRDVAIADADLGALSPFVIVGGTLLTDGEFDATPDARTVVALAPADGTPQWRTVPLADTVRALHAGDATHVVAEGDAGFTRVALATQTIDWSLPRMESACMPSCAVYGNAVMSDGSLIFGGEIVGTSAPFLARVRVDGSAEDFVDLAGGNANVRGDLTDLLPEGSTALTAVMTRRLRGDTNGFRSFARFGTAPLALSSSQIFSASAQNPLVPILGAQALRRIDATHLLAATHFGDPASGLGAAVASIDTSVTAQGDLSVQLSADASVSTAVPVHFQARIHYTGNAPLSGVIAALGLPAHTGVLDVGCNPANTCSLDTRGVSIQASFAIASGDTVTIGGRFVPLPRDEMPAAPITAMVRGPIGLEEADTSNNLAEGAIVVGLFADGFETR